MNSLPPDQRGAGAGMLATFQNSASVLSIGVFFTLMIVGLSSSLPSAMQSGLVAHGVSPADAHRVAEPAAGVDAVRLVPRLQPDGARCSARTCSTACRPARRDQITGRSFFPQLISAPFHTALIYAFTFAIIACLVAAVASLLRGGKYVHSMTSRGVPVLVESSAVRRLAGLEPTHCRRTGMAPGHDDGRGRAAAPHRRGGRRGRHHHPHDPLLRTARPARRRRTGGSRAPIGSTAEDDVDSAARAGPAARSARPCRSTSWPQLAETAQVPQCLREKWEHTTERQRAGPHHAQVDPERRAATRSGARPAAQPGRVRGPARPRARPPEHPAGRTRPGLRRPLSVPT